MDSCCCDRLGFSPPLLATRVRWTPDFPSSFGFQVAVIDLARPGVLYVSMGVLCACLGSSHTALYVQVQ